MNPSYEPNIPLPGPWRGKLVVCRSQVERDLESGRILAHIDFGLKLLVNNAPEVVRTESYWSLFFLAGTWRPGIGCDEQARSFRFRARGRRDLRASPKGRLADQCSRNILADPYKYRIEGLRRISTGSSPVGT